MHLETRVLVLRPCSHGGLSHLRSHHFPQSHYQLNHTIHVRYVPHHQLCHIRTDALGTTIQPQKNLYQQPFAILRILGILLTIYAVCIPLNFIRQSTAHHHANRRRGNVRNPLLMLCFFHIKRYPTHSLLPSIHPHDTTVDTQPIHLLPDNQSVE